MPEQPIHIVTDSSAHFPPNAALLTDRVTIVPHQIAIGGRVYHEGVDLDAEEGLRLVAHQAFAPLVEPPSVSDYQAVYERLSRQGCAILSIHASREISASWANAKAAAAPLLGHTRLELIDSGTVSTAQALLVMLALRSIEQGKPYDDVVRLTRSAVDRVYSVYYVETLDYLIQNKIINPSHGILGTMLGIKPFITIENGHLHVMEKVRTRIQAIERLVEFAAEFTDIEDVIILQHKTHHSEQTRMLQDRLMLDFPDRTFTAALYGPSLAALIGADATGLVILESEDAHAQETELL
ncbi:MAG: DegV family protein [bacterium]|nr:DegV family protein [bacterium]